MSTEIVIPQILQHLTEDREIVEVDGVTMRECLDNLIELYPETRWFCGDLPSVLVLLNREIVLSEDMHKNIKEGDKIDLVVMVAGG